MCFPVCHAAQRSGARASGVWLPASGCLPLAARLSYGLFGVGLQTTMKQERR